MVKKRNPRDLFTFYLESSNTIHLNLARFKTVVFWWKKRRSSFPATVFLSVLLHLFLFGYLSLSQVSTSPSRNKNANRDAGVIEAAIWELRDQMPVSGDPGSLLSEKVGGDIAELFGGFDFELDMTEKEKIEFYKKLIKSFLGLKQEEAKVDPDSDVTLDDVLAFLEKDGEWELSSGKKVFPPGPSLEGPSSEFYSLPRRRKETLDFLRRFEDHEKNQAEISRGRVKVETSSGIKYIPTEYYFRDSPYEEILAHGPSLFYIIRGFPALAIDREKTSLDPQDRDEAPGIPPEQGFTVIYLTGLFLDSQSFPEHQRSPLQNFQFSPQKGQQIRQILDGLMSFSEEDQFVYFSERYLDVYEPDGQDLAELTHEFIYNNLCNVIIVIDAISTAFDFIEELYFSKQLDFFFLEYWRRCPDTRTGLEFLFSIASHYDFERRALEYLIKAYRDSKRLLNRQYYTSNVYNHRAKAYVLRETYEDLFFQLRGRGYVSFDHVLQKYVDEQVKIYEKIIKLGGEAKNRALFALGRLYWDNARFDLALKKWTSIDSTYSSKAYQGTRQIIARSLERDELMQKIDRYFEWEVYESSQKLLERLLEFHKWEKREKADKDSA